MVERIRQSEWDEAGGIVSLATAIEEHREAIEYDLLTKTGYELEDVGQSLSWDALKSFLQNIGPDSALVAEINPEVAAWSTQMKTNAILADIYDILATMNANIVAVGSRKPAKKPKPYPRPVKQNPDNERHFGRDPLPPDELRAWFEKKRKQNAGSSKRDIGSDSGSGGSTAIIN